jgi:archaellum component FlaC
MHNNRQIQRSTDRELDLIECEDQIVRDLRSLKGILSNVKATTDYKASWNEHIERLEEKIKTFFAVAVSIDYIEHLATVEEMTKQIMKHKRKGEI